MDMAVTAENKEYSQLAQLVPLNTLEDDALNFLLEQIDVQAVKKGELLFNEGDVDNQNVYLLSGRVGLFAGDKQVDLIEDSAATSRFPIAHQMPRKFTAKALTGLDIVRIDSRILSEALAQNETAGFQIDEEVEDEEEADWMTQLLQSRVMQNIPAANLQSVMMRMQEVEVKADEIIINQGDEADFYYLLHRGHATVLAWNDEHTEQTEISRLSPGAAFGEDALLANTPRTSTVKMLTDGVLLRLPKNDFIELIKHPLSDTVDYDTACALIEDGALWVDVREPEVYEADHLPGAVNMPYHTLRFQLPTLSDEVRYVVYSQTGTRAVASAFRFLENGLHVSILEGGIDNVPGNEPAESDTDTSPTEIESTSEETAPQAVQTADSSAESAELRQQIESLQSQLAEKDEQLAAGMQNLSGDEAVEQLRKENEKLEREIITLTGQLESEEAGYDKLKQQYDSLSDENKKHLQNRDQEIASLKEQLTVLQLEKDQIETEYEELLENESDTSSAVEADEEDLAIQLQQALNQINQLEAVNASITEDRERQQLDLEEIRNQLSLANQENSELQLEIADLKDRLNEMSAAQAHTD